MSIQTSDNNEENVSQIYKIKDLYVLWMKIFYIQIDTRIDVYKQIYAK